MNPPKPVLVISGALCLLLLLIGFIASLTEEQRMSHAPAGTIKGPQHSEVELSSPSPNRSPSPPNEESKRDVTNNEAWNSFVARANEDPDPFCPLQYSYVDANHGAALIVDARGCSKDAQYKLTESFSTQYAVTMYSAFKTLSGDYNAELLKMGFVRVDVITENGTFSWTTSPPSVN